MILEAIEGISQLERRAGGKPLTLIVEEPYQGKIEKYEYRTIPTENGFEISDGPLLPFRPEVLSVTTLTGFVDAHAAGIAEGTPGLIIHVEDYLSVKLKSAIADKFGKRDVFLSAKHTPLNAFKFDEYYDDPARFIIALQVSFLQTEELLYLIRVASNLKAGNSVQSNDDGFSQTLTVKAGEVSTAEVTIRPRIKLIPIRTFPEASPVESEFLIRFKQAEKGTPSIAVFNVDGTRWQSDTMQSIKHWLAKKITTLPILA